METLYCGVDLHYGTSTFRFLDESGATRQEIEIKTERKAIENLLQNYQDFNMAYAFEAGNMTRYFHRIIENRENTKKIHVVHPHKFKDSQRDLTGTRGFARVINHLGGEPFHKAMIERLAKEGAEETIKLTEVEQQIKELVNQYFRQEYEWLVSIPGISFVTAATILSVIDDVSRFERAGQFSSYCGLIPSERSSGEKVIHGRITKEGVKELRSLFVQSAWAIVRFKKDPDERMTKLKKKYYRISFKQKNAQKAVTAIARHLSRIVYGVLKNQTPYCGEIINRAKACIN